MSTESALVTDEGVAVIDDIDKANVFNSYGFLLKLNDDDDDDDL